MSIKPFVLAAATVVLGFSCTANKNMNARTEKYSKLEVYGGYHPQEVGLGFRKIYPELNICHAQNGNPNGRLVVQYVINSGDGSIRGVTTIKDGRVINNGQFEACVVKAINNLKYNKLVEGNNSRVVYPLNFPLQ
jgi:hypothetical protein